MQSVGLMPCLLSEARLQDGLRGAQQFLEHGDQLQLDEPELVFHLRDVSVVLPDLGRELSQVCAVLDAGVCRAVVLSAVAAGHLVLVVVGVVRAGELRGGEVVEVRDDLSEEVLPGDLHVGGLLHFVQCSGFLEVELLLQQLFLRLEENDLGAEFVDVVDVEVWEEFSEDV